MQRLDSQILTPSLKMTHAVAWLIVLVLRSGVETAGQTLPPGFRYASYEVIIPKRQSPRYGHKEPQHVNYLLKIEGKSHLVYLRQKRASVPKDFRVLTYRKKGDLQVDYPFIRDDCFYAGFVHGMPASLVSLSTCSGGLRGVLQVENKTYEIEPVPASTMYQHVVYRLEEEEGAIRMRCGLTEEEQLRQAAMIPNAEMVMNERAQDRPWWTHIMHARIVTVVEHERYVQFGRNESVATLNVLNIIHLTNSWYVPIGVQLTLVGVIIWSEKNPINISGNIGTTLSHFNTWRKKTIKTSLPHDAGHLLAYKNFGGQVGLAYTSTICWKDFSSAVDSYRTSSLVSFTNTFAHEQGHILGMGHDDSKFCQCELKVCIMAPFHSHSHKFSNCSYRDYYKLMKSGKARCMFSHDLDTRYQHAYCGNSVVEPGEQCDCGSKENCEQDPCCQPDCRFRSGVTCAFGECCSKCQYLPAGTVCRKTANVCDLPEYCNGTSEWCPEDVYVQDGASCQDGAFCYHGNCSTHSKQCKTIFGSRAIVGSDDCFRELNTRGDRFGNCGISGDKYKKCNNRNALCGRIQCQNINVLPLLQEHSTIIQTKVNNSLCWGTDYHPGTRTLDIGTVIDGTLCDQNMICINKECTFVSLSQHDCNITKCQNRGICNSHEHCHCEYGWAPPDCLEKGFGGSTDSGPPPPHRGRGEFSTELAASLAAVITVAFVAGLAVYYGSNVVEYFRHSAIKKITEEITQE